MKKFWAFAVLAAVCGHLILAPVAMAKGRSGMGTGSKGSSSSVRGYTKRNGTYVPPSRRTTPDSNKRNNYSAKGNMNPSTGKRGTKPVE
jgi:hypothetical protein